MVSQNGIHQLGIIPAQLGESKLDLDSKFMSSPWEESAVGNVDHSCITLRDCTYHSSCGQTFKKLSFIPYAVVQITIFLPTVPEITFS